MNRKAKQNAWRRLTGMAVWLVWTVGSWGGEMQPTAGALIELDRTPGWNLGPNLLIGQRAYEVGDEALSVDLRNITVRLGFRPMTALHVWGEMGVGQADRRGRMTDPISGDATGDQRLEEDGNGSAGLVWAVGGGLAVFEYVLRTSPMFGHQESLALDLMASYRVSESDLPPLRVLRFDAAAEDFVPDPAVERAADDATLRWKDTRVAALFAYRLDRQADVSWRGYEPTGYALWGGPVYARTTGSYARRSLREAHDFGAWFGFDVRFPSGWLGQVGLQWMNDNDREIALSVLRYF